MAQKLVLLLKGKHPDFTHFEGRLMTNINYYFNIISFDYISWNAAGTVLTHREDENSFCFDSIGCCWCGVIYYIQALSLLPVLPPDCPAIGADYGSTSTWYESAPNCKSHYNWLLIAGLKRLGDVTLSEPPPKLLSLHNHIYMNILNASRPYF
jgi:hypothetical protein